MVSEFFIVAGRLFENQNGMPNLLLQNWVSTSINCLIKFGFSCRNLFLLQNVFVFEDVSPSGTDVVGDFDDVDVVVDIVEAWNVRKLIRPPSKPLLFRSFSVTSTLTAKFLRSSSPWLVWLSLLLLVLLVAVTDVPGEVPD